MKPSDELKDKTLLEPYKDVSVCVCDWLCVDHLCDVNIMCKYCRK